MTNEDDLVEAWRALAAGSRRRRDPEAEDHVQDAVVAALDEHRRTGRAPVAAGAWLRTVARRREVDDIRRAQTERRAVAQAGAAAVDAGDVAGEVLDRHEAHWLAGYVDQLPATTRVVVHELAAGRTQAEAADRLGLTPRAVEAHVRRARVALRRVQERAGAAVGLLLGHRWWRRVGGASAAGVAAAVGISIIIAPPDNHRLLPLPRPELPTESPRPDEREPRPLPGPGAARRGPGATSYAVAARAVPVPSARPTVAPTPPAPTPTADDEPPPVAAAPAQFVVVPSKGGNNNTVFPTVRGVWYEVAVSGTYSYDGRPTGLADCGHLVPQGARSWAPYQTLLVDDEPAPCWTMPVSELHTYAWTVRGTGRPMTFTIQDHGGGRDNLGGLAVGVREVAPPAA